MARVGLWAGSLGFALGGFFDGILLHQVLQWHHLLSLVEGVGDLRAQVLWDGLFHVLHYVLATFGLWGLWRAWRQGVLPSGGALLGAVLLGFGTWHLADAVLSHWLLGLHRIKLDAENLLAWDLGWLAVFGLLPMAIALAVDRHGGPGARGPGLALLLAALTVGAGAWASRTPEGPVAVVLRPGTGTAEVVAALSATDSRLVGGSIRGGVILVDAAAGTRWKFYRHGALLVGGAGLPPGCLSWSRASKQNERRDA